MSTDPSGKPDNAGGEDGDKTVSFESHSKLLGEKKKLQKDYEDMKSRLEALENEKLEKEGDYKKQNETLKAQLQEQKGKYSAFSKTVSEKVLKQQFAREAEKLGCIDADLAFKVCNLEDVNLDGNFELDPKVLGEKIQGIIKEKPHLFNKDAKPPRDKNPGNKPQGGKSYSEMTTAEMYAELAKIG